MFAERFTPRGGRSLNGRSRNFFVGFALGPPAGNYVSDKIIDVSQLKVLWELAIHCRDKITERSINCIEPFARGVVAATWLMSRIFSEDLCKCFDELMGCSVRVPTSSLLV